MKALACKYIGRRGWARLSDGHPPEKLTRPRTAPVGAARLLTPVQNPINAHPGLQHTIINNPAVNGCDRKVRSPELGQVFLCSTAFFIRSTGRIKAATRQPARRRV
jgi:hypothetical protein